MDASFLTDSDFYHLSPLQQGEGQDEKLGPREGSLAAAFLVGGIKQPEFLYHAAPPSPSGSFVAWTLCSPSCE